MNKHLEKVPEMKGFKRDSYAADDAADNEFISGKFSKPIDRKKMNKSLDSKFGTPVEAHKKERVYEIDGKKLLVQYDDYDKSYMQFSVNIYEKFDKDSNVIPF